MNRRELLAMMPVDKTDREAALQIVKLGSHVLGPVMPDIVKWLRVSESDVANIFCEFLRRVDTPDGKTCISRMISSKNIYLRNRLLNEVVRYWTKDDLRRILWILTQFATHPDSFNNDLICLELLLKHQLVESDWIEDWIMMRKDETENRLGFMESLLGQIRA